MQTLWDGVRVDRKVTDRRTKAWKLQQNFLSMKIHNLEQTMCTWRKWLDELHLPFIINQSVLLGLHREKRLFPNERVMEFAILGDDLTDEIFEKLQKDEKYQWRTENPHKAPHGLLYFRDMEIQPIYFKGDKAVYNLLNSECLVYEADLLKKENWKTIHYRGLDWNTPGDADRFLTQAYGDWKTPNPNYFWRNDANNKMLWEKI